MLRECFVLSGNIQAGHSAHFGVAERGHHCSQVIRLDANVAVVDDKNFIASFVYHPDQFGYFIVDGVAPRAIEDSNLALGKLAHQLLENRHRSVVFIPDAENQLVIRVVLAAIAGKILVGFRIEAADGLKVAHRRSKVRILGRTVLRTTKEKPGTVQHEYVVDEGSGSNSEKQVIGGFGNHCTSRTRIMPSCSFDGTAHQIPNVSLQKA